MKANEMACADCHSEIEKSENSGDKNLPAKEVCAGCHDVEDENNCTLCHIDMENLAAFVNPVRSFAFNHKQHVIAEKIECEKCHPQMAETGLGNGEKIPTRDNCNTCHNGLAASMECFLCHSSKTTFRPQNHANNWSREHMNEVRAGSSDCSHCHTNNYCQQCHEATDLMTTKILPTDFYAPFSPQLSGEQTLVFKSVHQLNYRFVHQLDASGKEKDCSVCHEVSSYCAECHQPAGSNSQIRPAWHGGPDWGAIALAVGSGGGRHAELARRDIERCAACHEIQGADPTCLMCHTDFDGIKNTDPKTHESGFANRYGEDASFHHDEGALCFTCHVSTNNAGQGFCGYCHGSRE